jgi:hypothetical protein
MWSYEALSAERYRPLLTASKRKQLLESPEGLSRKERQRLRQIALAGIYDLTFLLNRLSDQDRNKIFSQAESPYENPRQDPRIGDYYQNYADPESWDPPSVIRFKYWVEERLSEVDSSSDWAATEAILKQLDRDHKLAETTMETRAEILKPIVPYRRLEFGTILAGLVGQIRIGVEQNGVAFEELFGRLESVESNGPQEGASENEELRSFESYLRDISSDGSIIEEIVEESD